MSDLWFGVLGGLSVREGNEDRTPRPAKVRALLALLLVHAPDTVPVDVLIDDLWDENPPATATTALQVYISQLRRLLEPGRSARDGGGVLVTSRPGYALRIDPQRCDLHRFRSLADLGASRLGGGDAAAAAAAFEEALALWRGPVFADVRSPALHTVHAPAVTDQLLSVHEGYAEAQLLLGDPLSVVEAISEMVVEHPLRERLVGLLMTALDQVGRRDDALRSYEQTRRTLAEDLGIDPGPELRAVREQVRSGGPVRAVGASGVPAPSGPGGTPAQLPPAVTEFTGRDTAIAEVVAALTSPGPGAGTPACCEITGAAGVGKTALAVQGAHRVRAEFPGGQLVARLDGASGAPVDPGEVLRTFLLDLGLDGGVVPPSLDERSRLFRSVLSGRRVLVVLDDAASEAQVRPLLPGSASCAVLFTGRTRLLGLDGVRTVALDVLEPAASVDLLSRLAGAPRVVAEPAAAAEIAGHCGHLPLAVRIAGARLSAKPHWTLMGFARSLADERRRLDELVAGDLGVRSSISLSYRACRAGDRRALRLLGTLRLSAFPAWLVAGLLGVDVRDGAATVERLVDAQLVQVAAVDRMGEVRYRLHDLVRLLAAEKAAEERTDDRDGGVGRVAAAFADLLRRAEWAVHPGRIAPPAPPSSWTVDDALVATVDADPLGWAGSESGTAVEMIEVAHASGMWTAVVRLAQRLVWVLDVRSDWTARRRSLELALDAARRGPDLPAEAALLRQWGELEWDLGRAGYAVAAFARSRRLHHSLGDEQGAAFAVLGLAAVYADRGPLDRAATLIDAVAPTVAASGDRRGHAVLLRSRGLLHRDRGEFELAGRCLEESAGIFSELGDRRWWAYVLRGLVRVRRRQGRLAEAERLAEDCESSFRLLADRRWEAYALFSLAEIDLDRGRFTAAEERFRSCVVLFAGVGDERAETQATCHLGEVRRARGFPDDAVRLLTGALPRVAELGDPRTLALAGVMLGRAHRDAGRSEDATVWLRRSSDIYDRIGLTRLRDEATADLATISARTALGEVKHDYPRSMGPITAVDEEFR